VEVGDEGPEAGGDGGANGECQDWTEWKESTLDENSESESTAVEFLKGELVLCLDGGLVTSDRTGGAVIDLLQFCKARGRFSWFNSSVNCWKLGWKRLLGVISLSLVSISSSRAVATPKGDSTSESSSTDGAQVPVEGGGFGDSSVEGGPTEDKSFERDFLDEATEPWQICWAFASDDVVVVSEAIYFRALGEKIASVNGAVGEEFVADAERSK
jgi:hypothetical protein